MRIGGPKLTAVWLGGCAAASAGLVFWPQAQAAPPTDKRTSVYGGVEHEVRKTGARSGDTVFVLTGSAQPTQMAPQAASPALVGIVGRSAYLKSASSDETVSVSIGESLDGWKVAAVRGRTVTLEGPGGRREMSLFEKPASGTQNAPMSVTAQSGTPTSTAPLPIGG